MKQAKVLSEQELKRVLAVVAGSRHAARNRLAILLSHLAGLRVGEIAALLVGDVIDQEGRARDQLHLNSAYTKGGLSRTVFINKRLKREIEQYLSGLSGLPDRDRKLLTTQKKDGFSSNSLCQLFKEKYSKAGVDGASSHSGRRYFITKLAHAGVSPKVIMDLVGHKHLTTTQRYIDVNDEMKKAAVEVI